MPTICSAEMFAAISEAPMAHQGRFFEARKYSVESLLCPVRLRETHCASANRPMA